MSSLIERKTHLKDSAALSSVLKGCISPFRNVDDADRVGSPLGLLRAENCSGQPYHRGGTPGSKVALCEHRLHSYLGILVMPRSKPTSRVVLRQGQQGGGTALAVARTRALAYLVCTIPCECSFHESRQQLMDASTTLTGRLYKSKLSKSKLSAPCFLLEDPAVSDGS